LITEKIGVPVLFKTGMKTLIRDDSDEERSFAKKVKSI
jgi:hypothetical protein